MGDEYIRREDAKDALQEKVFHNLTDEFYGAMQVLDELEPADVVPYSIEPDGTLIITVPKGTKRIGRILIEEDGTQYGGLFYPDTGGCFLSSMERSEHEWLYQQTGRQMMGAEKVLVNVNKGQDAYSVIGNYILNHVTAIEDMIAVIQINGVIIKELYMVDVDADGYFYWKSDWWEGEEDVALLNFFPVSDAEAIPAAERKE